MSYLKAHIVLYKTEHQPHVVMFQNPDGSWGQDGDLEKFLGISCGKQKELASLEEAYEQLAIEAGYNEDKLVICRKTMVELRNMHLVAAERIDLALKQVEDVTVCEDSSIADTTERVVIDVSEDGPSLNDVPPAAGTNKRTPYTRSRAAREGKRARAV